MTTPNMEALHQIVRVIEELPEDDDHEFEMGHWMICGTSGCVMGWAASDPWFIERGFTLREAGLNTTKRMTYIPAFLHDQGFGAIASYLNIPYCTAYALFAHSGEEENRERVLNRVRKFIRDHE